MPSWIPRQRSIQDQLADEIAKQEAIRFVQQAQRNEPAAWTPLPETGMNVPGKGIMATPQLKPTQRFDPAISVRPTPESTPMQFPELTPIQQEIADYMPEEYRPQTIQPQAARVPSVQGVPAPSTMTAPVTPTAIPTPINKTEVKPAAPFWQRAMQVFAAPFNWIDEYLIKPGLSVAGTVAGVVPEVERKPGEDYWVWKRRSWAEWSGGPGVDINVPWSDKPWRVDIKGVAEFAPWLLIPGAGQTAGALGKLGKVGKVAGAIVSYSPWGLAEKTAGAVIKGTVKYGIKAGEVVSTKLEAKVFGKITPKPVSPAVQKLTTWFKEEVGPQYQKVREGMPGLRKRQSAAVQAAKEQADKLFRAGKITAAEKVDMIGKAREGGIKQDFPISPFKTEGVTPRIFLAPKNNPSLEGKAVFDLGKRKLLTPDDIADEAYSIMPDNVVVAEGHDALFEAKQMLKGNLKDTKFGESPRITYDKKTNNFSIRYDEDNYLRNKAVLSQKEYLDNLQSTIQALQKEYPGVGINIPEVGDFISAKTVKTPIFTPDDIDELIEMAYKADEMGLVKGILEEETVADAMRKLLLQYTIPEPKQLKAFARIYGDDFAKAVGSLRDVKPSFLDNLWDALNIPRAAMASGDLSGTFRQGLILTLLHPIEGVKAFGKQLKAFASEKVAMELDDTLRTHKLYGFAKNKMGVDFTAIRKGAVQGKEEVFVSTLAEHLPGVRRSERAYTTYLNQMRMAAVEKAYGTMTSLGATEGQFKLLGDFINLSTGRGKLPFKYEKYAPMFNAALFSPKYQASILQLPGQIGKMLISKNPYVRKQGALALTTFVGGGIGLLTILDATGVGKLEKDPRSTDFAKLKIGDTRIDIWRGYAQYSRFIAQMLTGQRKSAFGYLSNAERGEIAGRFIQTKLSPATGLIGELWRGETFRGEPVFTDTRGFLESVKEKTLPLAVQDIWDAAEQGGVNGLWTAAPALLGIGTLTYVNDYVNAKNKVAKENGYESWDVIDPKTQLEIERNSVELQVAEITYDRQVMGTAWGDWHLAGKAVEEVFRENVGLAVAQFKETGDGVQFREKISDAYTARKGGYEARTKEQRFADIVDRLNTQDPAQAMVTLGPEQTDIKTYNDALYGDDMYDQFGDYRYDEADIRKQQLRDYMGDKRFKYVEDYAGEKTADLPAEFQELKKAKIAMRPYWEIRDKIERLFGKRFAESPKGQAMISKLKKQMRATRPDIAKYYQLFYANN